MSGLISISDGEIFETKITYPNKEGKKFRTTVKFIRKENKLWLEYKYNKDLTELMKICLSGMEWHGFKEVNAVNKWSCSYDDHNRFQLAYLSGLDPYAPFDGVPAEFTPHYTGLKKHQYEGVGIAIKTRRAIWAYEMGLGKTLMGFELALQLGVPEIYWVSTRSALISVKLQAKEWGFKIPIHYHTYESFKALVSNWRGPAPIMLVGDESQKLKNLTAQRTKTFLHVTKSMREEHGDKCTIILMSGTPAPKAPLDWYSQCEIVQPGFLREGSIYKFKERLAVTKQSDKGSFIELLSWRDDEKKCDYCGKFADDYEHDLYNLQRHDFIPSVNEVDKLYRRMGGLVTVRLKRDCTDLKDKTFHKIYCKPSTKTLQAAKLIASRTKGAAKALTLLRELSDGFQYTLEKDGQQVCPSCKGAKRLRYPKYIGPDKTEEFLSTLDPSYNPFDTDPDDFIIDPVVYPHFFAFTEEQDCPTCEATGLIDRYQKHTHILNTPKDKAVIDLLDEYDEIGRTVLFAAFSASIDKLCHLVKKQDWNYIKLDGKGFISSLPGSKEELLERFQDKRDSEKIVFIGNPGSASTGLTLTASPVAIFYSNSFNGEDRMQAMDRIHRLGMDENLGARIVDLIHLPTDELTLQNLENKIKLQNISMGRIFEYVNSGEREEYDYAA